MPLLERHQYDTPWSRALVAGLLLFIGINFIAIPMLSPGPTYNRPLDWRFGGMVRDEIAHLHPEAAEWTVRLKPDDFRRQFHRNLKSEGTAFVFADSPEGLFEEKLRCRYRPEWGDGPLIGIIPFRPRQIYISDCRPPPKD